MAVITDSVLFSFMQCPHRVWMDEHVNPAERGPVSPLLEVLWEHQVKAEKVITEGLGEPFLDLSRLPPEQQEQETLAAMGRGETLIYGGRIGCGDLVGRPDFLRLQGAGYVVGNVKFGAGEEGSQDRRKPKPSYAVQLGLYVDILEKLGHSAGREGFILYPNGAEVRYDFDAPRSPNTNETLWQLYEQTLESCRRILAGERESLPALCAACKLCQWRTSCREVLQTVDDLTLIPALGRKKRDAMQDQIPTVRNLANIDPESFIKSTKTAFAGIGAACLRKFQERAKLLKAKGQPYLTRPVSLPPFQTEIFFDIEADPFRRHVYLHGFLIRDRGAGTTTYIPISAEQPTAEAERRAFGEAIALLRAWPKAMVFIYSSYERATYRGLQERYPDVISYEDLDKLFAGRTIDLLRIVKSSTEWPTNDHSIKTLAQYLGFEWRDDFPSGAGSIDWYDDFVRTDDRSHLQRILEYNEDDCQAMVVLLDALRSMSTD